MNIFVLVYEHTHGDDIILFGSEHDWSGTYGGDEEPEELPKELLKLCPEYEVGEWITIYPRSLDDMEILDSP